MEWLGRNKQRPSFWQWRQSFILGDLNWNFFQVGYPMDMYLSPNWMLNRVWSGNHFCLFFFKMICRAHHGVLVPTSLFSGLIVVFKGKTWKENLCQHFTAAICSTLAQHALKLICQTTFNSVLFKALLSHVGQLSCRNVMEDTWPKPRIFSCRRHSCSKRICFHSNQYFYIPQENVNLSNKQCVC